MALTTTTINAITASAVRLLALTTGRSRVLVLTYHRILPAQDPLLPGHPDLAEFRMQMSFLAENFRVLPLPEAVDRLYSGAIPQRCACVTFDDGYVNNHDLALPVLQSLGLTATFLIATTFLDGSCMWNDTLLEAVRRHSRPALELAGIGLPVYPMTDPMSRLAAVRDINRRIKYLPVAQRQQYVAFIVQATGVSMPRGLMMNPAHLRNLDQAGMDVGCHTVTHPILATLPDAAARAEIADSAEHVAGILGHRPRSFAYPNGLPGKDFLPVHAQMVRDAGFSHALTTVRGLATASSDRFQLPRISPYWKPTPASVAKNLARIYLHG